MFTLGIECTAHTLGIGIFDGKKILANERDVYKAKSGSGIVPADAGKHHKEVAEKITKNALGKVDISLDDIDLVAVSSGPGLPPCLIEGLNYAKQLKKPLLGVNHCVAHIEIGKFTKKVNDPLTIYVSGGNTQIIGFEGKHYRIFGETLDIGIGNAIDKFARNIGFEMPGGPQIEKAAQKSNHYIELPYTVKGMDLAFSGLVTAASKRQEKKEDVVFSFQETIFSMLAEVSERALAHTEKKELMLTGGVAQNKRLQEMLFKMCNSRGVKFSVPKAEYCGDNGAMIAIMGYLMRNEKQDKIDIKPRWRTDDVVVSWK